MSEGLHAQGSLLKNGAGVTIAEVTRINPALSRDEIDLSSHDSVGRWREFTPGMQGIEISVEGIYIPTHATHSDASTGIVGKLIAGTIETWSIEFPTTPVKIWQLPSFIRDVNVDSPFEDRISFTMTLRLTGAPVFP